MTDVVGSGQDLFQGTVAALAWSNMESTTDSLTENAIKQH
jgi:hypothetical protein